MVYGVTIRTGPTTIAAPKCATPRISHWETASKRMPMSTRFVTLATPDVASSRRAPRCNARPSRYGGRPARASPRPLRMPRMMANRGWKTKRSRPGPVSRAGMFWKKARENR